MSSNFFSFIRTVPMDRYEHSAVLFQQNLDVDLHIYGPAQPDQDLAGNQDQTIPTTVDVSLDNSDGSSVNFSRRDQAYANLHTSIPSNYLSSPDPERSSIWYAAVKCIESHTGIKIETPFDQVRSPTHMNNNTFDIASTVTKLALSQFMVNGYVPKDFEIYANDIDTMIAEVAVHIISSLQIRNATNPFDRPRNSSEEQTRKRNEFQIKKAIAVLCADLLIDELSREAPEAIQWIDTDVLLVVAEDRLNGLSTAYDRMRSAMKDVESSD